MRELLWVAVSGLLACSGSTNDQGGIESNAGDSGSGGAVVSSGGAAGYAGTSQTSAAGAGTGAAFGLAGKSSGGSAGNTEGAPPILIGAAGETSTAGIGGTTPDSTPATDCPGYRDYALPLGKCMIVVGQFKDEEEGCNPQDVYLCTCSTYTSFGVPGRIRISGDVTPVMFDAPNLKCPYACAVDKACDRLKTP
jgi:hypothetical protein